MAWVVRRSQRLTSHDPAPASSSATTAAPSSTGMLSPSSRDTAVTVRPTDTSAATSPSATTGTTERTDGPSVPV